MISNSIMQRLLPETKEELLILSGKDTIDRSIYMFEDRNVINSKKLLEQGKLITIRPHTRFIDFPAHTHDYIEVVYMCSGKTVHIINGNKIELNAGELLFLGTNAVQEIQRAGKDDIAVNFIILPQFFDKSLDMLGEEETPLKRFILDSLSSKGNGSAYLHFKVADILPIQNLVENLLYTLISDTQSKRKINQTTMGLLLLQLIGFTDRLSVEDKSDALLIKVFRYIEENYRDGALSNLADSLHFDLYWLSREIKRRTGKTYTELLQEKRLSQAAFLLRTTRISVADIALAVGYENVSYFHRIFASTFSMSPRKYRNCK